MPDNKLKDFMEEHFSFSDLKKSGFFPKEMKFNDYEGQAKRVCDFFELDSVYDYANIGRGVRVHISYAKPTAFTRFVETIGQPLMKVEGKTAIIIPINK